MDSSTALRIIAEISAQALQMDRDQQKKKHECHVLCEALKKTTAERDEAVQLADVLYETNQQMSAVIDHFLQERANDRRESESFEVILTHVLRQRDRSENGNRLQSSIATGEGKSNESAIEENPGVEADTQVAGI
ncbi:uncharacterized protein AKAW2_50398A [Aspergillus luchuensis]|uniref:Uncharacterized protein n=1 Tax=Aspergillus kawachii TaxID=1069201 RepID=A0A7R8A0A5_ASPKA|nr:uncharacterized protein AKAW2_50081S [Aspergillus luchuensis]XP_041543819.1 uncharacterized protein AKAW2_50398A [Aspergillus luchuensis]BCR99739.1 hypothetical protein AKAW2_50081S [Aspergillus luchuensis]BCS00057.1 hypothetical protein AKAW2_50398A [Aspergillus luchuensis]GAA93185.1 hypothetical protein AKAW_11297 [Aspergillus luchuensis IFO 4308]